MLKKTITYTNYNGASVTEDFYFNFEQAEVLEMEMLISGGLAEHLQKIVNTKDVPSLISFWKDFILKAYGEKTPDGKRFVKSAEISTAFSQTPAYSVLYMELVTNTDAAIDFVNAVIPADLKQQAENLPDEVKAKIAAFQTPSTN